eukprot:NODE_638_length_5673_cov_0.212953.p1 type:complete len:421 gc:universal NODE_638_length_5673_cov_0.212953:3432-2170(-)
MSLVSVSLLTKENVMNTILDVAVYGLSIIQDKELNRKLQYIIDVLREYNPNEPAQNLRDQSVFNSLDTFTACNPTLASIFSPKSPTSKPSSSAAVFSETDLGDIENTIAKISNEPITPNLNPQRGKKKQERRPHFQDEDITAQVEINGAADTNGPCNGNRNLGNINILSNKEDSEPGKSNISIAFEAVVKKETRRKKDPDVRAKTKLSSDARTRGLELTSHGHPVTGLSLPTAHKLHTGTNSSYSPSNTNISPSQIKSPVKSPIISPIKSRKIVSPTTEYKFLVDVPKPKSPPRSVKPPHHSLIQLSASNKKDRLSRSHKSRDKERYMSRAAGVSLKSKLNSNISSIPDFGSVCNEAHTSCSCNLAFGPTKEIPHSSVNLQLLEQQAQIKMFLTGSSSIEPLKIQNNQSGTDISLKRDAA